MQVFSLITSITSWPSAVPARPSCGTMLRPFRVVADAFPSFLPKQVNNIKDPFARNLAKRIHRLPVPVTSAFACLVSEFMDKFYTFELLHAILWILFLVSITVTSFNHYTTCLKQKTIIRLVYHCFGSWNNKGSAIESWCHGSHKSFMGIFLSSRTWFNFECEAMVTSKRNILILGNI